MEKETEQRKQFRRVLESVLKEGTYNAGHLMILENMVYAAKEEVRQTIKDALGIESCTH